MAAGYDSETGLVTLLRVKTAKAGTSLFVKGEPSDHVVSTIAHNPCSAHSKKRSYDSAHVQLPIYRYFKYYYI